MGARTSYPTAHRHLTGDGTVTAPVIPLDDALSIACRQGGIRSNKAVARPERIKLLILATTYTLPYRVLRCAKRCNADVYVLGNPGAHVLALSRYCDKFVLCHRIISGANDEELAFEINCVARDLGVTMILPGDAPSTRALIACRSLLTAPCFPLPDLELFDTLNDKWGFARLCREIALRHPATCLLPDLEALETELAAGRIAYPVIIKPRSLSGGQGVVVLNGQDGLGQLRRVNYRSIIAQQFIPGREIGASIYCRNGEIRAFIAHELRKRVYSTFWSEAIFRDLRRLAAHVRLDGIYNFDMIASDSGEVFYLECNPRFFFKMGMSMLAGINFVALGLAGAPEPGLLRVPDGTKVRAPEAVLTTPRSWFRLSRRDLATAAYAFSDPVPLLFDYLGWPT
jgi:hypothetical protein